MRVWARAGERTIGAGCFVLAIALTFATTRLAAQDPQPAAALSASDLKKAIELRQQDLDAAKKQEKQLETEMSELAAEREKLNARLIDAASQIQKSEGQLTSIEARLGELEVQEKMVRGSLNEQHAEISELMAILQRMGRNPPPPTASP